MQPTSRGRLRPLGGGEWEEGRKFSQPDASLPALPALAAATADTLSRPRAKRPSFLRCGHATDAKAKSTGASGFLAGMVLRAAAGSGAAGRAGGAGGGWGEHCGGGQHGGKGGVVRSEDDAVVRQSPA